MDWIKLDTWKLIDKRRTLKQKKKQDQNELQPNTAKNTLNAIKRQKKNKKIV